MEHKLKLELRKSLSIRDIARIEEIERKINPLLQRTTNVNIDFTEHDLQHALMVEDNYGKHSSA